MLLDTTFLIDLEREFRTGRATGAVEFMKARPEVRYSISMITVSEFAEGYQASERQACRKALEPYSVLGLSFAIAWRAGQISRVLRAAGERIGDHDVWIAATALEQQLELVTRNVEHFSRIEDLQLVSY